MDPKAAAANWYQSPMAADQALAEPLKRATEGRDTLRAIVRALLIRRVLTPQGLAAMETAKLGLVDIAQVLALMEAALGAATRGSGQLPPQPKPKTGILAALTGKALPNPQPLEQAVSVATTRVMVKAMHHVVKGLTEVAELGNADQIGQVMGVGIARALAEEVFPPMPHPDPNRAMRVLVGAVLGARALEPALIAPLSPLDRQLVAKRLEDRLALLQSAVQPASAQRVARVVRSLAEVMRLTPPAEPAAIVAAVRGGG